MINVEAIYRMQRERLAAAKVQAIHPPAKPASREAEAFWQMCEQWGAAHPLHSHPYLDYVFDPRNNDLASVKRFVEVLYTFCERFHDCLFELGAHTHDEEIRRTIAYNLYDEYGSGNPRRGHLHLMRDLLHSMGYSAADIDAIRINPGAQQFMEKLLQYCRQPLNQLTAQSFAADE
jgi:pyrroloquinoline quinone (PQQ) biosynthesis protein C